MVSTRDVTYGAPVVSMCTVACTGDTLRRTGSRWASEVQGRKLVLGVSFTIMGDGFKSRPRYGWCRRGGGASSHTAAGPVRTMLLMNGVKISVGRFKPGHESKIVVARSPSVSVRDRQHGFLGAMSTRETTSGVRRVRLRRLLAGTRSGGETGLEKWMGEVTLELCSGFLNCSI